MIIRILLSLLVVVSICYVIGYGGATLMNIWKKEPDIKKILPNPFSFLYFKNEIQLPQPSYELRHTKEKYQQGLKVHGIEWEEGFLLYEFTFMNKSKHTGMEDVRLKFELPGSFVAHKIASQEGVENIAISSENDYLRKVNTKTETVVAIMPYRTNVFIINIGKAHPYSFIKYNLIFANNRNDREDAIVEEGYTVFDFFIKIIVPERRRRGLMRV